MGLGDPTPKLAVVTLADVAERKAALGAINAVFPVKKKHDNPPNKDQGKQDLTKSGNFKDRSKDKTKNNNDKDSGNNNNNNSRKKGNSGSTGRKSDGSNSSVAKNGDGQGSRGGEKTHQLKSSSPISGGTAT